MSNQWDEIRLTIPGDGRQMCTLALPDLWDFDPVVLDEHPIVLAHGAGQVTKLYDSSSLAEQFGDRWLSVQQTIEQVDENSPHEALGLAARGTLTAEGAVTLERVEAELLNSEREGIEPTALLAAILLVRIQAEIEALLEA